MQAARVVLLDHEAVARIRLVPCLGLGRDA